MANSLTSNFALKMPARSDTAWDDPLNDNFIVLDALLAKILNVDADIKGQWSVSTTYAVDDIALDTTNSTFYVCLVGHTSASSGTFSADRTANPSYWQEERFAPDVELVESATLSEGYTLTTTFEAGYNYKVVLRGVTFSAMGTSDTWLGATIVGASGAVDWDGLVAGSVSAGSETDMIRIVSLQTLQTDQVVGAVIHLYGPATVDAGRLITTHANRQRTSSLAPIQDFRMHGVEDITNAFTGLTFSGEQAAGTTTISGGTVLVYREKAS